MAKLSRFQKNLNDYVFYLLMMCEKCSAKGLRLYDKNSPFIDNFEFLTKIENELSELIDGDEDLLLNQKIPSGPSFKELINNKHEVFCGKHKGNSISGSERKCVKTFLQNKYMELSTEYPTSWLDMIAKMFKIAFFVMLPFDILFALSFNLFKSNSLIRLVFILFLVLTAIFIAGWICYGLTYNNCGPKFLQFKIKFSTWFCYEKLMKSKEILEQIVFENDPFQRLEENRLYRQIIKENPKMKAVFKVMIENSYWHYDGFNVVQTEKCTRQLIGKLASDSDLGIKANGKWRPALQKLMLLPEPLYNYDRGKDDATWNEVKQLIIEELKK